MTVALNLRVQGQQLSQRAENTEAHVIMTWTFSFSPVSLFSISIVTRLLPFQP